MDKEKEVQEMAKEIFNAIYNLIDCDGWDYKISLTEFIDLAKSYGVEIIDK